MLRSIFGRGKRKRRASGGPPSDDTIRAARVGDVLTITGLDLEYDDLYFYVERIHRYSSPSESWYEMECADGDHRLWIDWVDGYDLFITATDNPYPAGLSSIGLTEEDLIALDEEHSIDNCVEIDGDLYHYKNSSEVLFHQDARSTGQGFYSWDFIREQGDRVLTVSKWEGRPFEVVFSEVIPPSNIILYKSDRDDSPRQRDQ